MTQRDLDMMNLAAELEEKGMSHTDACRAAFETMLPADEARDYFSTDYPSW